VGIETVGVIGLGYVGQPVVAAMANVGYTVVGMDVDAAKVARLAATYEPTIFEPGLAETFGRCRERIRFTASYADLMQECAAVCITVGTPVDGNGRPDTSNIDGTVAGIAPHLRPGQVIVLRSTVVPGTTARIGRELEEATGLVVGRDFFLAFCPERTIEGIALYELYNLPTIIGGITPASTERTAALMERLGSRLVTVSSPTVAELCKLADNMYRALNIAFANEFGAVCETAGVDAYEVVRAVNSAYARTNIFRPGLGADGPCLSKDPLILRDFARAASLTTPIIDAAERVNRAATRRVTEHVGRFLACHPGLRPKVALLGLAFKGMPETDDVRGSAALTVFDGLVGLGPTTDVDFVFFDPIVREFNGYKVAPRVDAALAGANVVLFLSDHPALRNVPARLVLDCTARPLLVVDAWHNVVALDRSALPAGVTYVRFGDGT
jgi:nucleotide sugar dehydrogenase